MAEKNKSLGREFTKGLISDNPVLRLVLGTCPSLALSTSLENAIGMGIAATFVLILSNMVISALRKVIPSKVRIPCFIVIIAAFVTIIQLLVKAYAPSLDEALGIYLPLIVVNCIILGRAEAFASKNGVIASAVDGLGMGIGFMIALSILAIIREFFGSGNLTLKVLGYGTTLSDIFGLGDSNVLSAIGLDPILIFILAPGGFFVYGLAIALFNAGASRKGKKAAELNCCKVTTDASGNTVLYSDGETIVVPKAEAVPQVKPVEKAAPAKKAAPAAKPVKAETPAPAAEPAKAETPAPAAEPAKAEAPAPVAEPAKAEAPAPAAEPAKAEAPAPAAEPAKAEAPAPAAEPAEAEAPVPAAEPAEAEAPAPAAEPAEAAEAEAPVEETTNKEDAKS